VAYEAGGLPYSGEYHGPQGFFDLLAKTTEGVEFTLGPDPQCLWRASGKSVEMRLVEVYTVRDGLIVKLDVYYKDPSAVAALLDQ
jgi:uncharacterized protein